MPIKFLLLGGGGVLGLFRRGGVEVPILFFLGVGICPTEDDPFWVLFLVYGGVFSGFQNFGPGGIVGSVLFVEIPGLAIQAPSSRRGAFSGVRN